MDMPHIHVRRYTDPKATGWAGFFEPTDKSWIGFVGLDGRPLIYLHRDPETGAVLPDDPTDREKALEAIRAEQARRVAWTEPQEGVYFPVLVGEAFQDRPMPPASFGTFDHKGKMIGEHNDGWSPDGFKADGMLAERLASCIFHPPSPAADEAPASP